MNQSDDRAEAGSHATHHLHGRPMAVLFDRVSFAYGTEEVLSDVSFHIHEGEFAALIGPNGSGKTTILRLLLGLAAPASGRVEVLGAPAHTALESLGYVPQNAAYDPAFPISVAEVVLMGRLRGGRGRYSSEDLKDVDAALEQADVADLRDRPYSALSGGQRRRVLVARALASRPRLLVLDEPTANMDVESETRLFRALGELKGRATVLVVTHDTLFVSDLTDAVLCVGDRDGRPGSVVRHASVPIARGLAPGAFGGGARQVLHDTEIPPEDCCGKGD